MGEGGGKLIERVGVRLMFSYPQLQVGEGGGKVVEGMAELGSKFVPND